MSNLANWTPRPLPSRVPLDGQYIRLEPLEAELHGEDLYEATIAPGFEQRFQFLSHERPPKSREDYQQWLELAEVGTQCLYYAIRDKSTQKVGGWQVFWQFDPQNGLMDLGIFWGPGIARTRMATEAFSLFAEYAFDTLGYRRLVWRCDARHEQSRRAAQRLGFQLEGILRQDLIVRGENRDTALFAMLDREWPMIKLDLEEWLKPENFNDDGSQKSKLTIKRIE